jgi:Calcium-activated chloride channel.
MSEKNLVTVINHSMTPGKKGVVIPIQGDIEKVGLTQFLKKFNFFKKSSKSKVSNEADRKMRAEQIVKKMISYYKEERYIPDVVVVFKVSQTNEGEANNALLNSVNFYISIAANFDAYLAPGVDKNLYYLMIKMNEEKLAEECSNLGLKMKLLNSYEYEAFDYKRITDFEPFRSRQRQEITLNVLKKLLDVDQLKEQNVIQKIYLMHTVSGAHRIKEIWLKSKRWYWPEPLTSYKEYFSEGKHLNFTAITALRQYFGEKTSFYFAWVSFYTVYLLILAVPGVVFFILNQRFQDHLLGLANLMLSIWVGLTALATTLLTERWKRKGAEIATRWGVLGLLSNTSGHKQVRKEFSGDEMISETTGYLTKYNGKSRTVLYFIASFPVLLLLLALVVATFIATYQLQDLLNDKNVLLRYLPGIINGIVITIINYLYGRFARYFVEKENHKYQSNYERSLIFKTFLFKFLNSFLGIFYIAFIQDIVQQNHKTDTLMTLPLPNNQDRPPVIVYQRSKGHDNAYLSNYLSNTLLSLVITRQISSFVASVRVTKNVKTS